MSRGKFGAIAPFLLVDGTLIFAIVMLLQVDWIVHHTLYNYNLHFSFDWAVPYWTALRLSVTLLLLAVTAVTVLGYFSYRKTEREIEKTVFICRSCGDAWVELNGNVKIGDRLPKFKILKNCPSCNKKLLEEE